MHVFGTPPDGFRARLQHFRSQYMSWAMALPRLFLRRRSFFGPMMAILFFASFLVLLPQASAQAVYGSIFGTVTDNTGAVVPNAAVTVTDIAKGTAVTVQSNA